YFHKRLFILQTNSDPIQGFPDIVMAQPRTIGKKTYLTFGLILSTPQFREDARAFVIANDPELKIPGRQIDLNNIRIDRWPIITLDVKVIEPLSGSVLGRWLSPPLEAAGSIIEVPVGFDNESLELFKRLASTGDIQFMFSYTFTNIRVQFAVSISKTTRQIN